MYTGPRIIQDGLVLYLDVDNLRTLKSKQRVYDYSDWTDGSTGNIGDLTAWPDASQNQRVWLSDEGLTDPWGNDGIAWKSFSGQSYDETYPAEGGIYGNAKTIDNTQMYRVSYWDRRFNGDNETYGRHYVGLNGYGTPDGIKRLTDETINTNPYFTYMVYDVIPSRFSTDWYLTIGHIYPWNTTYTENVHPDSGYYTVSSGKTEHTFTYGDWRWLSGTTTGRMRSLNIYRGDDSGTTHYTMFPRMDLMDGTEPSIDDLVNGVDRVFDLKSHYDGYTINGGSYGDNYIYVDGVNDYISVEPPQGVSDRFTINTWIKPIDTSQTGSGVYAGIVNAFNGVAGQSNRFLLNAGFTQFLFQAFSGATTSNITSDSFTSIQNKISMCTITYDGTQFMFYVNGDSVMSTPYPYTGTLASGNNNFTIGWGAASQNYYIEANFYSYQIYNRALTPQEVLQNYNVTKSRFNL